MFNFYSFLLTMPVCFSGRGWEGAQSDPRWYIQTYITSPQDFHSSHFSTCTTKSHYNCKVTTVKCSDSTAMWLTILSWVTCHFLGSNISFPLLIDGYNLDAILLKCWLVRDNQLTLLPIQNIIWDPLFAWYVSPPVHSIHEARSIVFNFRHWLKQWTYNIIYACATIVPFILIMQKYYNSKNILENSCPLPSM